MLRAHSPQLLLAQPAAAGLDMKIAPGYVSPRYGIKHPAPIVEFTRSAAEAEFWTVLYPFKSEAPDIRIEPRPGGVRVTAARGGARIEDDIDAAGHLERRAR
jgi:hypothetical protein